MAIKRFDPDDVLDRALDAFWRTGYAATSAQDLVDATGINRGSMYATYGSKSDLYRAALTRYRDRSRQQISEALSAPGDIRDRVRGLLNEYADQLVADPARRGCFLVNATAEAGNRGGPTWADVTGGVEDLHAALTAALTDAQTAGQLATDHSASHLADFLVTTVLGLRVLGKATHDRHQLQRAIDLAVSTLDP